MPTAPAVPIDSRQPKLTELQRDALVLVGHHVPADQAAVMLDVARAQDVLAILDQAVVALSARGYYAAYRRAAELGLLGEELASDPTPIRQRHVNRHRSRHLRVLGPLNH